MGLGPQNTTTQAHVHVCVNTCMHTLGYTHVHETHTWATKVDMHYTCARSYPRVHTQRPRTNCAGKQEAPLIGCVPSSQEV